MRRTGTGRAATAWFLRILVVLGVAAVALLPPLTDRTEDTASITAYDVAMELSREGELVATETIDVAMPGGKRGIFRIFDVADPRRDGVEHPVDVEVVERDGRPEPYTEVDGAAGTMNLRIGSESTYLTPGSHVYRIVSTTSEVFEPGDEGETLWWWDVVGSGWQMSMGVATVSVQLPAEPLRAECVQGEDTPCTASVEGTSLRVRTGPLDPFTPVTVRVAFDADDVATPVPGDDDGLVTGAVTAVLVVLAAGLGIVLWRRTRETTPGLPVLFEPPFMVPPALGVKVLDEKDSVADLQATLFDLAERGVIRLEGDDDSWRIELLQDAATEQLHPIEQVLLGGLGLTTVGSTFTVSASASAGEVVGSARTAMRAQVASSANTHLATSGAGITAWVLGWTCVVAVVVMVVVYFFGGSGWVLWPLLAPTATFAIVALGMMLDHGVGTTRTPEGRDLWSRTGGFARFLTTDSSEARFDAAAHMDWYPRYLPWAVAFGVADEWAGRYEAQGVALPAVPWLLWTGTGHGFSAAALNQSFDSAISSASSAYAATQSSSSGGGFSGGSGGGGGGGGSW